MSSALTRYRVMAYVVGVLLFPTYASLFFTLAGHPQEPLKVVALIHGYLYIGYLAAAFDLYRRSRWSLRKLLAVVAAGLVPGVTFVAERRVTADARAEMAAAATR